MFLVTSNIFSVILLCAQLVSVRTASVNIGTSSIETQDKLDFIDIAARSGYAAESYDVITEDGYILTLYHIPGNKTRPVFLMSGMMSSANSFILTENKSLAVAVANNNYDVWVGADRGTVDARRHLALDPDVDKEYWNYSFHEVAIYDVPAMVDFILDKTGQKQLSAIAFSQGTTLFYVLGATKPEYNAKIKILVSLAPICYLENSRGLLPIVIYMVPVINEILKFIGREEVLNNQSGPLKYAITLCRIDVTRDKICSGLLLPSLFGYDPGRIELDVIKGIFKYFPAGTSKKYLFHGIQSGRTKMFTQYDYGPTGNYEAYNSTSPPAYDLSKVTKKIALIVGQHDFLSVQKDAKKLRKKLPNVVDYYEPEPKSFSHIDFMFGRDAYKVVYPHVIYLLKKYE